VYAKKALLQKDTTQARVKLQRVGEAVFEHGEWQINDEEVRIHFLLQPATALELRHLLPTLQFAVKHVL
jgi:hypothetical protein